MKYWLCKNNVSIVVESSFEWSREENESCLGEEDDAFKTAVDFNDTKLQKKQGI